jgi:hypothetical protein
MIPSAFSLNLQIAGIRKGCGCGRHQNRAKGYGHCKMHLYTRKALVRESRSLRDPCAVPLKVSGTDKGGQKKVNIGKRY